MTQSQLRINDLHVDLFLGHFASEHEKKRTVSFDVLIQFPQLPNACTSDELDETCCYAKITKAIEEVCQKKHFKLIEHLCHKVYFDLKPLLVADRQLAVRVTKQVCLLPQIKKGSSFCCHDDGMLVSW